MKLPISLLELKDEELWGLFADSIVELKTRKLIRTRNIVGERGEFIAINTYNSTTGLPKLQVAPEGTQNIDAISRNGERYSIKTITAPGKTTGTFHGCGDNLDSHPPEQKFEYVVIVEIYPSYKTKRIVELNWEQFLRYRRWHSTMRAWNLSLTSRLLGDARTIFDAEKTTKFLL